MYSKFENDYLRVAIHEGVYENGNEGKLTGRLATVKMIVKQYRGACQEIAECTFLGDNNDSYYLLSTDLYEYFDAI